MKKLPLLVGGAIALALSGCAHVPATEAAFEPDTAATLVLHRTHPGSGSLLLAVDGRKPDPAIANRTFALPPGNREILVSVASRSGYAETTLVFEAATDRIYRLRSLEVGQSFRLRLWDETEGRTGRTLVTETQVPMKATLRTQPIFDQPNQAARSSYRMPTEPDF